MRLPSRYPGATSFVVTTNCFLWESGSSATWSLFDVALQADFTRSHWALGTSLVRALSYGCGNVEVVERTFYRTLRVSSSRLNHMTDLSINITIYRSHVTMHTATTIQMIGCCNVFAVPWSSCIDSSVVFLTVDQNTLAPAFLWALFCNHGSIPRRYRKYSLFASYPQARLLCNETGRMRLAPKKERGLERIRGN